ncbi:transporter [Flavobacteriaceae bacterium F89]|uniref:Transporter n=1 Tax=Cerina litoralis TaxID=2874477 RepID=A0AAE3EXS7_9FLAO|nr:neuromedin U [Cerina litoralis]MCG2462319.1 transporter [Cerina litoralis]
MHIPSLLLIVLILSSGYVVGQEKEQDAGGDLEKKIQNPIANLISVPFQNNTDFGVGSFDGTRNTLNIQPVIPLALNENLNLITRTIIPIISQPTGPGESEFGLGDISLSMFLTPAKPGKVIYGGGVALGVPTGTDQFLGSGKWTAGPSLVLIYQPKGWTFGSLIQNSWSYAGAGSRGDVNFFYSQVFVTKNLQKGWYVNSAPIITANWEASSGNQWTIPLGAGLGKLFRVGKLPINAQAGYYFNVEKPAGGPDSQLRVQATLLFPK